MEPPDPDSPRRGVTLAPLDPARVGRRFVTLYALSYAGGSLLFLGPLLVSLALKVNDLVGIDDAPKNLALVTGVGLVARDREQPALRPAQRPDHLGSGHATPVDDRRPGRRGGGNPDGRPRPQHRGRARRLVHCTGLPQRPARRPGRDPARPCAHGAARPGLRNPGRLPPRCLGGRHLPCPGLRGTPADDVPRAAVGRRRVRRHLHQLPSRPPARRGRQAAMVAEAAGSGRSTSAREPTPTSPGPSPAGSCWSWPTPSF